MKSLCLVLVGALALCSHLALAQLAQDDQVLTGFPSYHHPIYSGYLDVSVAINYKSIHYVYFESQRDRAKDPIILWLSGGPGCSGMLSMLQENGPFLIAPETEQMSLNENAWNKRAGIIYFELPAGVGFSVSSKDEKLDDATTMYQAMVALRLFLDRHSNLKKNDLYIAGSGYGAIFAAKFARDIIDANNDPASVFEDKVALKGLLLGNPCVNSDECFASGSQKNSLYHYEFLYSRGFYPKSVYQQFLGKCALPLSPLDCYEQRLKMDKDYNATNTSAYNIYNKCYKSPANTINLGCEDETGPITYLNDADFKRNWNIKEIEGHKWEPCSQKVWTEYVGSNGSYHLMEGLIKDNMRIWVYSGDMDSTVPIIGTKKWLHNFKAEYQVPVRRNWREWWVPGKHKGEDQVGGFIWELEGLTFVAVKGAGFKAAQDQPVAMEEVLNGFLDDKTLPYKS